jgi:hypothetical protein
VSKRKRTFNPRLEEDGSLDPNSLADMGERWILAWLRDRLAGEDPYLPIDRRSGEDPDAKVVGLLRSAGPRHPASRLIGRASARLLREAEKHAPELPAYFASLLRLCQQVGIPDTEAWFANFVNSLAAGPGAVAARWRDGPVVELLYAAVKQARGEPGSALHASWRKLLLLPRYTTHALIALGPSFEAEMDYLPAWWQACPLKDRPRELRQRITRAAKLEGDQRLREVLLARWYMLPADMRGSIDVLLAKLGLAPIANSEPAHIARAIRNAGQRREFVLAHEARC